MADASEEDYDTHVVEFLLRADRWLGLGLTESEVCQRLGITLGELSDWQCLVGLTTGGFSSCEIDTMHIDRRHGQSLSLGDGRLSACSKMKTLDSSSRESLVRN